VELTRLAITNFKNIPEARLEFSPKVNCFLGNNGMGKSNLLDAVYYLSFCKSFSGVPDMQLIRRGEAFATLRGNYVRRGLDEELTLGLQPGHRKSFKRSGKEYDRLSAHIGAFPLVMVSPADSALITGTGEERRRLMDMVISQADPIYLDHLIRYGRALQQRNKLLRDRCVDPGLYMSVEMAMERSALYLTSARQKWTEQLTVIFNERYRAIASDGEVPAIQLKSHLAKEPKGLEALLDSVRRHDEMVGYTTVGPHRDDLELQLNEMPVRRIASQGQCKTYTLALRLAQYSFLEEASGMKPLLLLDDVFDRLDAERVERLVEVVSGDNFGQIFITDTNRHHLDEIVARTAHVGHTSWLVRDGAFTPLPTAE
jgi:DNA replication and repair protein RecF